jgi:hypothetical protein
MRRDECHSEAGVMPSFSSLLKPVTKEAVGLSISLAYSRVHAAARGALASPVPNIRLAQLRQNSCVTDCALRTLGW